MSIVGTVHVDTFLTGVSNAFKNKEHVATDVFPAVSVVKETGMIPVYGSENLRLEQTLRDNGSPSRRANWSVSNTSYILSEHALSDSVTDRDRDNYDPPIQAEIDTTEHLTDRILLRREYNCAAVVMTTTTWSTNESLNTATSWTDVTTTADPCENAFSAASSILLRSAQRPNQCVMGYGGYDLLRTHRAILDRIKYTQLGQVTPGLIAALFDVDRLIVGTAIRDAGVEGASSSNTAIWDGTKALFMWVPDSPGLKTPSAGYTLQKGAQPFRTRKWRDEAVEGDIIEASTMFQFKAVATAAGYLFISISAA